MLVLLETVYPNITWVKGKCPLVAISALPTYVVYLGKAIVAKFHLYGLPLQSVRVESYELTRPTPCATRSSLQESIQDRIMG